MKQTSQRAASIVFWDCIDCTLTSAFDAKPVGGRSRQTSSVLPTGVDHVVWRKWLSFPMKFYLRTKPTFMFLEKSTNRTRGIGHLTIFIGLMESEFKDLVGLLCRVGYSKIISLAHYFSRTPFGEKNMSEYVRYRSATNLTKQWRSYLVPTTTGTLFRYCTGPPERTISRTLDWSVGHEWMSTTKPGPFSSLLYLWVI